ncbi:Putative diflavin flavoprotein A 6 [Planktothrix tepida]|uniref:Diflavin flavoprotein A 6 n=2 Tax=Planktothrix TaxID=54304 RepID=A0A9W4CLC5_9CYAN|nr:MULTISPECIES: diflavin flavoprotein [Planktothrix]CAD5953009.1 Putative diflavin flavoprotein A 6 [Planktothrix pseudagardhii]CAD5957515.1 Putative diflavin flavoprotein A 6 [Planktothrix tepida]CUR34040.1 putative diflavin flavoprotein A 6 [Planktothrix tepida PCC 9214]
MSNQKPRDVQVFLIGNDTKVVRSRTWDRLKFEVEYSLQRGTTANSYIIEAEQTAIIDPPGESFTQNYIEALQSRLNLEQLNYIILGHFNANRGATLKALLTLSPQATFVCSNPAALALREYFEDENLKILTIKGEETLDLGQGHQLQFILTPTPRWPDEILTYDPATEILFSDKLFGAHVCGDQVFDEGWSVYSDDRRFYYDCLHAAQAKQVLSTLDKIKDLPAIKFYATGHGPLVKYGMTELTNLYQQWSEKQKSNELNVALIYASAYGNTATVAQAIAKGLTKSDVAVELINCEYAKSSEIQEALEKCDGFIIGSPTLGGHAPTQVQTALGVILNTASTNKLAGVFGSYGWSGEAIDLLEGRLKDAGYKFGFEPIRVKFAPTDVTLHTCKEAAVDFAQTLKRTQKRRAFRPTATSSGADRTAQAIGRIVGSLCVVSGRRGEVCSAMLASWVSQATFNPPGFTVAVAKDRALEPLTHIGDPFVLNILQEGKQLRKHFLKRYEPGEDRFVGLETEAASNGCLILKDALAYLECEVKNRMECGDHWVIYATVNNGHLLHPEGVTAVHYRKTGSQY